ncbi:MAG: DUF1156 domain-containing protein [Ignavibacteria bacterium]|nr:DUF1156 domain-containing protein [Ignavibacteria bacterium]
MEVDFPLAEVGRQSLAEKTRRSGTPHQLHLWWSRKPLTACRAILLSLLWPDPCDARCPDSFKQRARQLLPSVVGTVGPTDEDMQKALLRFVGDVARLDLSTNHDMLEICEKLIQEAHGIEPPFVVDPLAGGGSIPLEAMRLGCDVYAGDLNPVACLILKAKLNDIPLRPWIFRVTDVYSHLLVPLTDELPAVIPVFAPRLFYV